MKKIVALVLKLLATGSVAVLMAACYGVTFVMKTITALAPEGTGIKDLSVTLHDGSSALSVEHTDERGMAMFRSPPALPGLQVAVEDTDGALNGGEFLPTGITLDDRPEYTVTLTRK